MSLWTKLFGKQSHTVEVRSRLGLVRLDDRSLPSVTLPEETVWVAPMLPPEQPATAAPAPDPGPVARGINFVASSNNNEEKKDEPKKDDKSTGSETKPDPKAYPPGSTGTDRNPNKGDEEDKRTAEREKAVGDIIQKDYQIERQPKVD